jgi:hypothetical protein
VNIKTVLIGLATVTAYLFVLSKTPVAGMVGLNKTSGFGSF